MDPFYHGFHIFTITFFQLGAMYLSSNLLYDFSPLLQLHSQIGRDIHLKPVRAP